MNKPMTKRMTLMLVASLAVFGSVFGMQWFGNKMMNQAIDSMPMPPATISTAVVKAEKWSNTLEAIGSFVPVNGADLTVEVGGVVTAISFESGARVNKGDRLISLDVTAERAELARLQAQAELAELNRARREKLWKLESVSKSDYDTAVSEAAAAKAAVQAQAALVAKKEIRAPFAGIAGIRRVNVGEYLQPGTKIVTLQSLDPIDIDFALPEQHLGAVQPGYTVSVRVDSYPDQLFSGKVLAVEPRVDAATRNFSLRARVPNADLKLRAGQFGRLLLNLPGDRDIIAIPRTAISYSSYGTSVFVVQKKASAGKDAAPPPAMPGVQQLSTDLEVVQRFVKLGPARGDYIAIAEGLKPGEEVASSGLLKLRNQQPVIVNNALKPPSDLNPTPAEG